MKQESIGKIKKMRNSNLNFVMFFLPTYTLKKELLSFICNKSQRTSSLWILTDVNAVMPCQEGSRPVSISIRGMLAISIMGVLAILCQQFAEASYAANTKDIPKSIRKRDRCVPFLCIASHHINHLPNLTRLVKHFRAPS